MTQAHCHRKNELQVIRRRVVELRALSLSFSDSPLLTERRSRGLQGVDGVFTWHRTVAFFVSTHVVYI